MPIGYLITAVLLGACTLAALWPLRSQSAVGTVVYLALAIRAPSRAGGDAVT